MHSVEPAEFGIKMTFAGAVLLDEMNEWLLEFKNQVFEQRGAFNVLVDMRNMRPLAADATKLLQAGQRAAKNKGMQRSAVLVNSNVIAFQLKRIAQSTGIYRWERYIDASSNENWEEITRAWLEDGVDPDVERLND